MTSEESKLESESDAPHILPLQLIRLETPALRRARIVKNVKLEGMVELFSDDHTGSGQVRANELPQVMDMRGPRRTDLVVMKRLCSLPSYDVFSLRVSLKELGIKTTDPNALRMSADCRKHVSKYVRRYTRPLLESIYGETDSTAAEVETIADLFMDGREEQAKANLVWLADGLKIDLRSVPIFVGEYGDVTGSLAFYEYGFEAILPATDSFLSALADLREMKYGADNNLVRICVSIEERIRRLHEDSQALFSYFEAQTRDMWRDISAPAFNEMKRSVRECYKGLGGSLCAMTVKMKAWEDKFPRPESSSLSARADFIRGEMQPGLEAMPSLGLLRQHLEAVDGADVKH